MSEPEPLRSGKEFHKKVQRNYYDKNIDGNVNNEQLLRNDEDIKSNSTGRMDILVNNLGDMVSVIEIKNTNWDRIKLKNIKKNLYSHQRQLWKYIDEYVDSGIDVCPGIIYPARPKTIETEIIESYMNERGIQVAWFEDEGLA